MIRNVVSLVAEVVIREAETNNISVINIIDNITAQGFPLFMSRLAFLTIWEKETADPNAYRTIFSIALNEQNLHTQEINIDFQGHLRHRQIVTMQGLVIPQPGPVIFRLAIDGGPEATFTLNIQAPQPAIRTE